MHIIKMNDILVKQVEVFCEKVDDKLSFLANMSALINENMSDINWVGFYLLKDNKLHLGPFQGKVACELIDIDKGVCGTSFSTNKLLNVANVHEFKGHIACDNASKSELVVPLTYLDNRIGVLDIDSPIYNRFTIEDESTMSKVASLIAKALCE